MTELRTNKNNLRPGEVGVSSTLTSSSQHMYRTMGLLWWWKAVPYNSSPWAWITGRGRRTTDTWRSNRHLVWQWGDNRHLRRPRS